MLLRCTFISGGVCIYKIFLSIICCCPWDSFPGQEKLGRHCGSKTDNKKKNLSVLSISRNEIPYTLETWISLDYRSVWNAQPWVALS